MISLFVLGVAAASSVSSADPCSQVCDEIPGACGLDGSRCVDGVCTDLFRYNDAICNSSMPECLDGNPLSCENARALMAEEDDLGVVAAAGAPAAAMRRLHFVPGFRATGRRGFKRTGDPKSSYLASVLQVLLHSQAISRAVSMEIHFHSHRAELMDNPIFAAVLELLQRMFDGSEGALDLTEFMAPMGFGGPSAIDDPFRVLEFVTKEITRVSESLQWALTLTSSRIDGEWIEESRAVEVLLASTLTRKSRWSIEEMLEAQMVESRLEHISHVPDFFSIALDRYPPGSADRVDVYVETPMEIDYSGLMEAGETHRYRLVGIVREVNGKYVADYWDADSGEWIHANDTHLHVIQGQPRNAGADAVMVFYEKIYPA